jgi:hypothetical protein
MFLQDQWENRFFTASGVHHAQHKHDQFRFRRDAFYSKLKCKVDNHPSHSQTSRLVSASLSLCTLGTPSPFSPTVCEASSSSSFNHIDTFSHLPPLLSHYPL